MARLGIERDFDDEVRSRPILAKNLVLIGAAEKYGAYGDSVIAGMRRIVGHARARIDPGRGLGESECGGAECEQAANGQAGPPCRLYTCLEAAAFQRVWPD